MACSSSSNEGTRSKSFVQYAHNQARSSKVVNQITIYVICPLMSQHYTPSAEPLLHLQPLIVTATCTWAVFTTAQGPDHLLEITKNSMDCNTIPGVVNV